MSRRREAPLVDPSTDQRRSVGLAVGAAFLGVHEETLRRRIEEGIVPAHRDGKVYRIRVAVLVRYKQAAPTSET